MFRKSLTTLLFALACSVTLYSEAADEAPAPRPVGEKKPDAPGGKFGGKFDPEKLKEKFKNIDPEKLKELKAKFGDKFGKGGFDPEKLKELKEKLKKD